MITSLSLPDLNAKEERMYMLLLDNPGITTTNLAKFAKESRTNTYMILKRLLTDGLIEQDITQPIIKYRAARPNALNEYLTNRQNELQKIEQNLKIHLPELQAKYKLAYDEPGVIHLKGIGGFKSMLDQMNRSKTEIVLFPSQNVPDFPEPWDLIQESFVLRKKGKVKTRAIFRQAVKKQLNVENFKKGNFEIRFGGEGHSAEFATFEDKTVFNTYGKDIVTTIIINAEIANMMRVFFDMAWAAAKS